MITAVAIITGVTEAIKRATGVNTRYVPIIAVALGVAYAVAMAGIDPTTIIDGIVAGLTSVGLFRTVQKTIS